jgi:hypothetical protein
MLTVIAARAEITNTVYSATMATMRYLRELRTVAIRGSAKYICARRGAM